MTLPPPWVRRCDWAHHASGIDFRFPGYDQAAEGRELHRLRRWSERSERNAHRLAAWMAKVDQHRLAAPCGCPACAGTWGAA